MKRNYCSLFSVFICFILYGCDIEQSDYMAFDNVSYINEFPKSYSIKNGQLLNLNLVGVESLSIQDSILIVSTADKDGFWSFFKMPDYTFLGKYITKGKSDQELIFSPRASEQFYVDQDGEMYSIIYSFSTGKILSMNITKTLKHNRLVVDKLKHKLPRNLFNFMYLDSLSFFCRQVNGDHTKQSRFLLRDGEKSIPENMKILNEASIDVDFDINILGTFSQYNSKTRRVVEAALDMNLINLYSIDAPFRMTICTGHQLDKISDIQKVERRKKKVMYGHLASYDNYFGALYQNDTNENIHYGKAKNQTIQFFDWNGKPLIEVILDRRVNSFDIDFVRGCLFTLSYEQDEIYVYDFKEVLECLK